MSYENQPQSSSAGVVIAVVAVVVLLLLGGVLVVAVAGFWLVRVSAPVMVSDEPTMVAESFSVEAPPTMEVPAQPQLAGAVAVRTVTIELDEQGKLLADGKSVDLDALVTLLRSARAEQAGPLNAVVRVDRKCPFEHVAAVQTACREVGIDDVRMEARDGTTE